MTPATADAARSRPTASQELLLRVCLADDDAAAVEGWQRWCASTDLDAIDEESFRHLPLAWYRLQGKVAQTRTYEIAKGVYRQAWYRNSMLLRTAGEVLTAFAAAGIESIPLKGTSLAVRYFPAPATRPMVDIDLLVPHARVEDAFAVLRAAGWRPVKELPVRTLIDYAHAISFVREQTNLDLHWNALWAQRRAGADAPFWENAVRIDHHGAPAWALAPSDELFHACMHGARRSQNAYSWAPLPLIRWISDAIMIARRDEVDWVRIDALAARYHARLQMYDAFLVLRRFGLAVPDALLAAWSNVRSPADELHYELALAPRAPRVFAALPRFRFWKSWRMKGHVDGAEPSGPTGAVRRLAGFPPYVLAYVKADLDAPRLRDVPLRLARKIATHPSLLRP